jgi:hypothetical protein
MRTLIDTVQRVQRVEGSVHENNINNIKKKTKQRPTATTRA